MREGVEKRRKGENWAEVGSRLRIGERNEKNGLKDEVRSEEGGGAR